MSDQSQETSSQGPAWKAAEAYGCDMSLIESNLRKPPRQRIREHCRALRTAEALQAAMEKRRAEPGKNG